jgi:hypothetical protein
MRAIHRRHRDDGTPRACPVRDLDRGPVTGAADDHEAVRRPEAEVGHEGRTEPSSRSRRPTSGRGSPERRRVARAPVEVPRPAANSHSEHKRCRRGDDLSTGRQPAQFDVRGTASASLAVRRRGAAARADHRSRPRRIGRWGAHRGATLPGRASGVSCRRRIDVPPRGRGGRQRSWPAPPALPAGGCRRPDRPRSAAIDPSSPGLGRLRIAIRAGGRARAPAHGRRGSERRLSGREAGGFPAGRRSRQVASRPASRYRRAAGRARTDVGDGTSVRPCSATAGAFRRHVMPSRDDPAVTSVAS